MHSPTSLQTLLIALLTFTFNFWPLLLAVACIKIRNHPLRAFFFTWGILLTIRLFLVGTGDPLTTLFIPEPYNTVIFFSLGLLVMAVLYIRARWLEMRRTKTGRSITTLEELKQISPLEFEELVVELFQALGHEAYRIGAIGDHGVDVIVQTKNGEKCIVQCKRWRGYVGEPVIRDFYGVMQHEKADKGVVITAGKFSHAAQEWAQGKPIALYDGEEFLKLWKRAHTRRARPRNDSTSLTFQRSIE